jgi:prepilin-type N-terminal cleavage/methylation domain-containing protein
MKNNTQQHGFTLIELLIVASIFAIIVGVVATLFVSALKTQKNVLDTKKILGQVSYTVEYMTRSLRMAEKDTGEGCLSYGSNYKVSFAKDEITFRNALQDGKCQRFFLQNEQIMFDNGSGDISYLTSNDIHIKNLKFEVHGQNQGDSFQPFVTIYFEASTQSTLVLKFQSSVSQRNIDITK